MDEQIVHTFAGTPPPRPGRLQFPRLRDATAEIFRLENLLGIAHVRPPLNIFAANLRAVELGEMLARKTATAAPAPVPVATTLPAPALHGRQLQLASTKIRGAGNKSSPPGLQGRARFKAAIKLEGQKNSLKFMDSKIKSIESKITRDDVEQEMQTTGESDFWQAKDKILHRLVEQANDLERQQAASLAAEPPPWRLEPSPAEIQNEMRAFGLSIADASEKLRRELAEDARMLSAYNPNATPEIAGAVAASQAAEQRARELIEKEQAVIDDLKAGIVQLAGIRQQIRRIRQLALDKVGARELRRAALKWWLAAKGAPSTQNVSALEGTLKDLLWRTALGPEINEFAGELESQATALIGQIRTRAENSKINLREFVELWKQEGATRPGANLEADFSLYAGLIQNGE